MGTVFLAGKLFDAGETRASNYSTEFSFERADASERHYAAQRFSPKPLRKLYDTGRAVLV